MSIVLGICTFCNWAKTDWNSLEEAIIWMGEIMFHLVRVDIQIRQRQNARPKSLICWNPLLHFFVKEDHCLVCFIFRTFPILFLHLSPFPRHFSLNLSTKLVLSGAFESSHLYSGGPTCLSVHQTHPWWAPWSNSKLKTHYWAISPLIMLSNDLISLNVSPVSHLRPCQLSTHVQGSRVLWFIMAVCTSSQPVLIKNRIEPSIFENMSRQSDRGHRG